MDINLQRRIIMNKVNELVLCRQNYDSQEVFEDEIKKAVMVLLNANQIMTIRYDEPGLGIVVIEYKSAEQSYGDYYPYWLLPEEIESVIYEND